MKRDLLPKTPLHCPPAQGWQAGAPPKIAPQRLGLPLVPHLQARARQSAPSLIPPRRLRLKVRPACGLTRVLRASALMGVVLALLAGTGGCGPSEPPRRPQQSAKVQTPPTGQEPAAATPSGAQRTATGQAAAGSSPDLPGPAPAARQPGRASGPPRNPAELEAALKAANPQFKGAIETTGQGPYDLALAIHDPAVEDLRPLAGLPFATLDLARCGVSDLGPLKGMPIQRLYLEETRVKDLSPLRGMPLRELYLSHTDVEDLSPLSGAPLEEVNLVGTQVSDLRPLARSPIKALWLNGCPVSDIRPLASLPLVSLTLADTKVADLSPLKGHALQRLHIAGTPVSDLSVLRWLRLTRLIFTPSRIQTGLEHVRQMDSLQELDVVFPREGRGPLTPEEFWQRYDAGEFR